MPAAANSPLPFLQAAQTPPSPTVWFQMGVVCRAGKEGICVPKAVGGGEGMETGSQGKGQVEPEDLVLWLHS
jgi:hypothetical protein